MSYAENATVQAKIVSFFTDNAEKWGFLSDELDAGIKKANWASYDKTNWYYYRCNLAEYLTKTKRTAWPASCGAFDGMSDPAWVGYYELNYTVDDNIMLPQLYKEGYTFLGWFNGDTKVDMIKAGTTGNLNLVAKWEKIKVYHDLNLDLDGGTLDEAPTNYLEGEEFVLPIPTKEGYIFLGWYNGGEKVEKIFATETSDISLVAKWKGLYKLNLVGYTIGTIGRALVVVAAYMGSVPLMIAFTAVAAFGMGPWQGDMNAVIANCSEYTYLTKHKRVDGTMYSCTSLGVKLGGGLGTAITGWLLEFSHFNSSLAVQPDSCLSMLHTMYLWIPVVICVIITFIMSQMNVEKANEELKNSKMLKTK